MNHALLTTLLCALLLPAPVPLPVPFPVPDNCPAYLPGVVVVARLPALLTEVSGMAASRSHPDVVWLHNDSGDLARLYALDLDGALRTTLLLPVGWPIDCEALALGPAPDAPGDHLYLADSGNNGLTRSSLRLYRVKEPNLDGPVPATMVAEGVATFVVDFAAGKRSDFEAFAVDPVSGELYFFSKQRFPESRVYRAPAPRPGETVQLVELGTLAIERVTGADISLDNRDLLVRTYEEAFLWQRREEESWADALGRPACDVPLASERQGEAIAFAADGSGYFTLSEGSTSELFYYPMVEGTTGTRD
jgi:hypothetical protein